jgi:hypothetical protein
VTCNEHTLSTTPYLFTPGLAQVDNLPPEFVTIYNAKCLAQILAPKAQKPLSNPPTIGWPAVLVATHQDALLHHVFQQSTGILLQRRTINIVLIQ